MPQRRGGCSRRVGPRARSPADKPGGGEPDRPAAGHHRLAPLPTRDRPDGRGNA